MQPVEGTRTLQKKTVRERIIEKGNKWSFEPKLYLSKFGKPSTTVDIWSSRARRGYMAVSIHLNTNTGLETKVLDLAHIPSPHTGANIKRKFDQILNHHGLDISDTYKVVSDNASNMKKAFQVSLWEDDAECTDADEPSDDEIGDEDSMDDDLVQDVVDVDFQVIFKEHYRQPCTIHTLQLFVKDCVKVLPVRYQNVLSKARVVCRKMHHSTKLSEAMSKQLPAPGETRWNGQFRLLLSVQENFEEVQTKLGLFVDSDLEIIKSLVRFLQPFYTITKQLEAEKTATIQDVIPSICYLERHIQSFDGPAPFKEDVCHAFERRFAFVNTDLHLLAATALSQHGLRWLAQQKNKILKFPDLETVKAQLVGYLRTVISDFGEPTTQQPCQPPAKVPKTSLEEIFGYDAPVENEVNDWEQLFMKHLISCDTLPMQMDSLAY